MNTLNKYMCIHIYLYYRSSNNIFKWAILFYVDNFYYWGGGVNAPYPVNMLFHALVYILYIYIYNI